MLIVTVILFNYTSVSIFLISGSNVLGAHLLSDVINNIEMQSDYYKRKTLAFVSRENTELHKLYKMADRIGKSADLKP